jgi:hypothetical protein
MMREVDHNVLGAFCHSRLMSPEEVAREDERRRQQAEALARLSRLHDGHEDEVGDSVAPLPRDRPDPAAAASGGQQRRGQASKRLGTKFKKVSKKEKRQQRRR